MPSWAQRVIDFLLVNLFNVISLYKNTEQVFYNFINTNDLKFNLWKNDPSFGKLLISACKSKVIKNYIFIINKTIGFLKVKRIIINISKKSW